MFFNKENKYKAKKNKNFFFESFVSLGEYAKKEIELLVEGISNFDNSTLLDLKNSVHKIEHEADQKKREIEKILAQEFITPIDREDIFLLLDNIDDLSDSIDEISYKLYIRNYTSLPEETMLFANTAKESVDCLIDVLKNLHLYNKEKLLSPYIEKVLAKEEEIDKLYEEHVHKLYINVSQRGYDHTRLEERIYAYFENVTDKCRDICKTILLIIYKNI